MPTFAFCRITTAALLLGAVTAARAQAPQSLPSAPNRFLTDSLDSYVQRGMRLWNIPGLAVVVVKDGQTVVQKGYGVREVGKPALVDAQTLFMIASNTKLFTGTALAKLDGEKKISLDDRVTKYMPDFRLYDSTSTRLVTVRDLLSHHLGFKTFQGDFTFFKSNLERADIVRRMRLMQPTREFRKDYGYCNSGFVAAGEVIPAVTGTSWEDYVRQNLLQPLGMKSTFVSSLEFARQPNIATAYSNTFGPLAKVQFDNWDNMGPCASMASNVTDLTHWLRFQLDSGRYEGQQVLPWAALRKTRDANTIISSRKSPLFPTHFVTYGLGVEAADYNGRQVYWHTGGASGQVSNVCFVPEAGLGLAVLTNNDNQSFFEALRYQILDAYLGVPYIDRSAQLLARRRAGELAAGPDPTVALAARVAKKAKAPLPLKAYVGEFENALFGRIQVTQKGKQLLVTLPTHPGLTATLDYMDGQEFRATYSDLVFGVLPAKFEVENGRVKSLEMRANDYVEADAYVFGKL